MLVRPTHVGECYISGIDPGTNTLGFSLIQIDPIDLSILCIKAETFRSDKMLDTNDILISTYGERVAKLMAHKNNLLRLFRYYKPIVICCESPFFNRLRPGAYGALMETMFAIKTAAIEYDRYIKFNTYEPSIVKKSIGANSIGDKLNVLKAMFAIDEIKDTTEIPLELLDDHSIDAIAVGYTFLKNIRGT